MIGQIVFIDGSAYMQVNDHGTLEGLPEMRALPTLWLYLVTRSRPKTIGWIRDYVQRHRRF